MRDTFVGQMKGVILSINDDVNIVDIHHEITPYQVPSAAFALETYYDRFPKGTIHICIVDPGVGSRRRPIIVSDGTYFFVGPDNGIFSLIYKNQAPVEVLHITSREYFQEPVSSTFHGRDIFAPVAAWLSKGTALSRFGERITEYEKIAIPLPDFTPGTVIHGEIISIDHFGNAITNITGHDIEKAKQESGLASITIVFHERKVPLMRFYADAEGNALHALLGSNGFLELFAYQGNAAETYDLKYGDRIQVLLS